MNELEHEDKLRREILADAERKGARAVDRARQAAQKRLEAVTAEVEAQRQARLAEAQRRADERAMSLLASTELERRRLWLRCQEEVIEEAIRTAETRLLDLDGAERQASLSHLLTEALGAFAGQDVTIRIAAGAHAAADRQLVLDAVARLPAAAQPAQAIVEEDAGIAGGLIVEGADGRCRYDNTYAARIARTRNLLRSRVAQALGVTDL
ncbi:MAG: V-type ATP synthase subunit E [Lentisphaerae bacterium ADurb.BinA184]|nr:MAG: V-type ATP synthase subunit E [Lentisphaerae bacterium ADurb.BinA184]